MFSVPSLKSLKSLPKYLRTTAIDDVSDCFSCLISASFFIIASILIFVKTYVGSPLDCWLPKTFSGQWTKIVETNCFLKNTFQMLLEGHIREEERHRLTYYQWSSMYLALAGIAFMIPKFLWRMSQSYTDMSLIYFCDTAQTIRLYKEEERKEKIKEMAKFMREKITAVYAPGCSNIRMSTIYVAVKMLYLLIALGQLIFLGHLLGQRKDLLWGWTLSINIWNGVSSETRINFCDFQTREMAGNKRDETIQCVIGVNDHNERIFSNVRYWLIYLFFVTAFAHVYTAVRISKPDFIYSLLYSIHDYHDANQEKMFRDFGDEYLKLDGKLILRFVKSQSYLVAQELAIELYRDFEAMKNQSASIPSSNSSTNQDMEMEPLGK